jgi:predicted Rossmann-fold nucleotide-binding protein
VRRVCVFCGSIPGRDPRYAAAAAGLAREEEPADLLDRMEAHEPAPAWITPEGA